MRLGAEGARPFYEGDIAAAISAWVTERGGMLTDEDLRAYEVVDREPIRVGYRGREVLTNPPPSAGGILIARALAMLGAEPGPPTVEQVVEVMERTQRERTPEFLDGLSDPEFVREFLRGDGRPARLHDAHRGARLRRLGMLGDMLERIGVRRGRPRHRHPPQQHAR